MIDDLPVIKIKRVDTALPQGSSVEVNGVRLPCVRTINWHLEAGSVDVVTITMRGRVEVESVPVSRPSRGEIDVTSMASSARQFAMGSMTDEEAIEANARWSARQAGRMDP